MRPFRFLAEARAIADGKTVASDARRAEAMGYSVLVIPDHLIEQLSPILKAAGSRFADLEFNIYPSVIELIITDHAHLEAAKVADGFRQRTGYELTEDEVLESPSIFIGSVDGFVQKFQELRERFGISSIMLGEIDSLAPVLERLAGT